MRERGKKSRMILQCLALASRDGQGSCLSRFGGGGQVVEEVIVVHMLVG